MIHTFAQINIDSELNADDSNHFHMSPSFFPQKKIQKYRNDQLKQLPGASSSASASACELSQEIPVTSYQTYEDTNHLLDATTIKDYNFYTTQDVEGLVKQIPDISPYIDSVPEDEEPTSKSRSLTKKELAKLSPEAKILNISSNKKAKEIKQYLLEKFDMILVDT